MTIQRHWQERKDSFEFTYFIQHTNPIPHTNPQAHGSFGPRGQFVALEKLSTANVATSATSPDDGHATLLLYIRGKPCRQAFRRRAAPGGPGSGRGSAAAVLSIRHLLLMARVIVGRELLQRCDRHAQGAIRER